ncbi:MAG: hypothetical protein WC455_16575 [Dehalococcoidia bacterium]|jgi:hypothetical protein
MKDKELRESFEKFLQEWEEWKRCDRKWSVRLVNRIYSIENNLGLTYEYVEPVEGRFVHRKVEPSE